jgi:hypothetical protein
MNPAYPPLRLAAPVQSNRRRERPRPVPTPPEVIARRAEIALRVRAQVEPLATRLRGLTDAERKAVFYKLEHEGPLDARKLGLKPLAEPSDRFTIVIPRDDLAGLERNIERFEQDPVDRGIVPKAEIARITAFSEGHPSDRLSQDLFSNYAQLVRQRMVIVEIELLSVAAGSTQQSNELRTLRQDLQREIGPDGMIFEHEETKGSCRAVIRCSGEAFQRLVEGPRWQRTISWFEPRPQFQTYHQQVRDFSVDALGGFSAPEADAPVVCIVDTGVSAGNPFLRPVTRDDLLRSFLRAKPDDPSDEFGHGSGVASLVAYYALNIARGGTNEGRVWVASARVLDENNNSDERLFSAALREVVEFFVPLGVKIFNLSVNVRNRRWTDDARRTMPRRSWIARRIDHLSREHDVLFVVSAGNIDARAVRDHAGAGMAYPSYLATEEAALLDPAQSALALTVGSIAPEGTVVGPAPTSRAIANQGQASPFTRCGPGVGREIKPELVEYGGNYVLDEEGGQVRDNLGCSVPVASHQLTPALRHQSGTSLAAARVAHKAALIARDVRALGLEPTSALLKAFAVNSARHPLDEGDIETFARDLSEEPKRWLHVFGYGVPDIDRATACDPYSVVLYHQGDLQPDTIALLEIPVPAALQATNGIKRLTVTVVHTPEVQQWGLEQYLGVAIKWRMFRGDVPQEDVFAAMSRPEQKGIDPPDLPQEISFGIGINQRSRGTVQHDVAEWKQHRHGFSDHNYTLALTGYSRWSRQVEAVPYAVVVRLEETTRTAEIYTEVRNALARIRVRT